MTLPRIGTFALSLGLVAGLAALASAQNTTTTVNSQLAGVAVDAEGVLRMHVFKERTEHALSKTRKAAARRRLGADLSKASKMRKVSLPRLEAAFAERGSATEAMLHLAGLTRVEYVFCYPETGDIVIAGPAEGWTKDISGRTRGIMTGRPTLELQDLVVAMRAFPPGGGETPLISCSIDPTKEGLANMQEFLRRLGPIDPRGKARFITDGLRKSLGLQTVSIAGVPSDTHFAQVLVEADYRMKMIGIGLEKTKAKLKSYVDFASPSAVAKNALQRWYFVPNYECVRVTEDGLGMQMEGDAVKLVCAHEVVGRDGRRAATATVDGAGKKFVDGFTAKYSSLARDVPVYAQLRNLIDLAVVAAFVKKEDYYGQVDWYMDVLGDEEQYSVRTLPAPERVETAVATVWKRNRLMTPIGGGVRIEPQLALQSFNLLDDEQQKVVKEREALTLDSLEPGQWWWD